MMKNVLRIAILRRLLGVAFLGTLALAGCGTEPDHGVAYVAPESVAGPPVLNVSSAPESPNQIAAPIPLVGGGNSTANP
jgi:hypothetical protein